MKSSFLCILILFSAIIGFRAQCYSYCTSCTFAYQCDGCTAANRTGIYCDCISGKFYDPSDKTQPCVPCTNYCTTCNSGSNLCDGCEGAYRSGTSCTCVSSAYYDPGDKLQACIACDSKCNGCSGSSTTCTACAYNNRTAPNCECNEKHFYYNFQYNEHCSLCSEPCYNCTLSATDCTSCVGSGTRNLTRECLCNDHYYSTSVSIDCLECHYSCGNCTWNRTCSSCSHANRQYVPYCECKDGYYEATATYDGCVACPAKCASCIDSTNCYTCKGAGRTNVAPACACMDGYYDTGASDCTPCIDGCKNCTNATCGECFPNRNQSNLCACNDGYYQVAGVQECVRCPVGCSKCTDFNFCTECVASSFRTLDGTGKCLCDENYKDVGNNVCQIICSNTTNRNTTDQSCKCNDGYFNNSANGNCEPCNMTLCLTCTTNSTHCLSCNISTANRKNNPPYCSCKDGYVEISGVCEECDNQCATCSVTKSNCTLCSDPIRTSIPTCGCPEGYYNVTTVSQCQKCLPQCKTCTTGSACTSCIGVNRSPSTTCLCTAGYYEIATNLDCIKCDYRCGNCTSNPYNCANCSHATRTFITPDNTCPCLTAGQYDDGSSADCKTCDSKCATCSVNSTNCLTCASGLFRGSPPLCECLNGYYDNSTAGGACTACTKKRCKTCSYLDSSNSQCTSCWGEGRSLTAPNCACLDGYYESNTDSKDCLKCPSQCKNCNTDGTTCTSCYGEFRDSTANCACTTGYYDVGEQNCRKCHYKCLTCGDNSTDYQNCTSCPDATTYFRVNDFINTNLDFRCRCSIGYYDNGSVTCQECNFKCQSCYLNATNCITCSNNATRNSSDNCACKSGFYENNVIICPTCPSKCSTCSGATTCILCSTAADNGNRNQSANCACNLGYVEINNKCVKCNYKCATCSGTADNCVTCSDPTTRDIGTNCACRLGWYNNGTEPVCPKCSYECAQCVTTATNCIVSCSHSTRDTIPSCACDSGYYNVPNQAECPVCGYRCNTCTGSALNCLTCKGTNRASTTPSCPCSPGYFDDFSSANCPQCSYRCLTCETNSTNCLTCNGTHRLQPPGCACEQGYFDNGVDGNCQKCDDKCIACSGNAANCTICNRNATNRINNPPSCSCHHMFYDSGSVVCAECLRKCYNCSNSLTCLTCLDNPTRDTTTGDCNCLTGYFNSTPNQKNCEKCSYKCGTCSLTSSNCDSCNNGGVGNPNNRELTGPNCDCLIRYFDTGLPKCEECAPQCASCNETASNCLSCVTTPNRNSLPICLCLEGFYETGNTAKTCEACPIKCTKCSTGSVCTGGCGENRNSSQYCNCNSGYHELSMGFLNLGLSSCKADCSGICQQISVTREIELGVNLDLPIYSKISLNYLSEEYPTYHSLFVLGLEGKFQLYGVDYSGTDPVLTMIRETSAATGSERFLQIEFSLKQKVLLLRTDQKIYSNVIDSTTLTAWSAASSSLIYSNWISNTSEIILTFSDGWVKQYNLSTPNTPYQQFQVTTKHTIQQSILNETFLYSITSDGSIFIDKILGRSQFKQVHFDNQTTKLLKGAKRLYLTQSFIIGADEENFVLINKTTNQIATRQQFKIMDLQVVLGSDVIVILHQTPQYDINIYNLSQINYNNPFFTQRLFTYEIPYEYSSSSSDNYYYGPFYDQKSNTLITTTAYASYNAAVSACDSNPTCNSIYYKQDQTYVTGEGYNWVLGQESILVSDSSSGDSKKRTSYIKAPQGASEFILYQKDSQYLMYRSRYSKNLRFFQVCSAGKYLQIYKGKVMCLDSCLRYSETTFVGKLGFCKQPCDEGYQKNSTTSECQRCPPKCALDCDQNFQCEIGCKGVREFSSQCGCPAGTYDDGTLVSCQSCSPKCRTCSDNSTNCLKCRGLNRSDNVPECDCNTGFYDPGNQSDCIQCAIGCDSCKGSGENMCLKCSEGYYYSSDTFVAGACFLECPEGYENEDESMTCVISDGLDKRSKAMIAIGCVTSVSVAAAIFIITKKSSLIAGQLATKATGNSGFSQLSQHEHVSRNIANNLNTKNNPYADETNNNL